MLPNPYIPARLVHEHRSEMEAVPVAAVSRQAASVHRAPTDAVPDPSLLALEVPLSPRLKSPRHGLIRRRMGVRNCSPSSER